MASHRSHCVRQPCGAAKMMGGRLPTGTRIPSSSRDRSSRYWNHRLQRPVDPGGDFLAHRDTGLVDGTIEFIHTIASSMISRTNDVNLDERAETLTGRR